MASACVVSWGGADAARGWRGPSGGDGRSGGRSGGSCRCKRRLKGGRQSRLKRLMDRGAGTCSCIRGLSLGGLVSELVSNPLLETKRARMGTEVFRRTALVAEAVQYVRRPHVVTLRWVVQVLATVLALPEDHLHDVVAAGTAKSAVIVAAHAQPAGLPAVAQLARRPCKTLPGRSTAGCLTHIYHSGA